MCVCVCVCVGAGVVMVSDSGLSFESEFLIHKGTKAIGRIMNVFDMGLAQ